MKKKLFTSLLALMAIASAPVFASEPQPQPGNPGVSTVLTVNVPAQLTIQDNSTNTDTTIALGSSESLSGTITTPIELSYRIITNDNATIYIHAKAIDSDGAKEALFGGAGDLKIVLANTDKVPGNTAIADAMSGSPNQETNANVIAYSLSQGTPQKDASNTTLDKSYGNNILSFPVSDGTYDVPFTLTGSPLNSTFSAHDKAGAYKATVYVTTVNPGA